MVLIEVKNLYKNFSPSISFKNFLGLGLKNRLPAEALSDVSFSLRKGLVLGIIGPNGAGKTTLLKIIATLVLPDKGLMSLSADSGGKSCCCGQPLIWSREASGSQVTQMRIKSLTGLVLDEESGFYRRLTGRQNLNFFAALYGLKNKAAASRISDLLELFKVDYADKRFDSYSCGMKKHFALIKGLLHNPELILLDEPVKSLDYASASALINFIKRNLVMVQGKTVIFTTHNMDEALNFADVFMVLHKGKVIAYGTLDELRKKINNPKASLGEIFLLCTRGG